MDHRVKIRYSANGHPERSEGLRTDRMGLHWAHDDPSFDCEVLRFAQDDQRFNALTVQHSQYSSPSSSLGGATRSSTAYA
jgi:hypothetical protein